MSSERGGPGPGSRPAPGPHHHEGSIKETLVSIIISLAMAFIAKSYVVEAFVIPTGSMAPTLLGKHMLFRSDQTGYEWAVNPWYYINQNADFPAPLQGADDANRPWPDPMVTDPMTTSRSNIEFAPDPRTIRERAGYTPPPQVKRLRMGDRILVHKYLYEVLPPRRWDVVVFKNPENATQNFIKRLVGLAGEEIWLADGDVFARPAPPSGAGTDPAKDGWFIARKPDRIQRALWRTIYSSEYCPREPVRDGRRWFHSPWSGDGWASEDRTEYRCDNPIASRLEWDTVNWPITDRVPYNEVASRIMPERPAFPVADLRMRCGVRPDSEGLKLSATISARNHEFQAAIEDGRAIVRMRPAGASEWSREDWSPLPRQALAPGRVTNIEFWHADQSLSLWIDGRKVVTSTYDWGPSERLLHVTGMPGDDYFDEPSTALSRPETYTGAAPKLWWSFDGAPVTLYRVGLDRDLYYQPVARGDTPGLATHPARLAHLGPDQFFACGDNSPASQDGRLWNRVDPWVQDIDSELGVVNRKLLLGKAFFVYFPSPFMVNDRIPVPDFGSMRFIR